MFIATNNPNACFLADAMPPSLHELANALREVLTGESRQHFTQTTERNNSQANAIFRGDAACVFFRNSTSPQQGNMSFTIAPEGDGTLLKCRAFSGVHPFGVHVDVPYGALLIVWRVAEDGLAETPMVYASQAYSRYFLVACHEHFNSSKTVVYEPVPAETHNALVAQFNLLVAALDAGNKRVVAAEAKVALLTRKAADYDARVTELSAEYEARIDALIAGHERDTAAHDKRLSSIKASIKALLDNLPF